MWTGNSVVYRTIRGFINNAQGLEETMNVKRKALRLRKGRKFDELFILLTEQKKGEAVLDELLDTDEEFQDRYIDWSVRNILSLLQNPLVFAFMSEDVRVNFPEKYPMFGLLNRSVKTGLIPVTELKQVLLDACGPSELERFEWQNPGLLDGDAVGVKDYLKASMQCKFMVLEGMGRA